MNIERSTNNTIRHPPSHSDKSRSEKVSYLESQDFSSTAYDIIKSTISKPSGNESFSFNLTFDYPYTETVEIAKKVIGKKEHLSKIESKSRDRVLQSAKKTDGKNKLILNPTRETITLKNKKFFLIKLMQILNKKFLSILKKISLNLSQEEKCIHVYEKSLKLSKEEKTIIRNLKEIVPPIFLANFLKNVPNQFDKEALIETLLYVARIVERRQKNPDLVRDLYIKKAINSDGKVISFPFVITQDNHLLISFGKFASGHYKKVSDAFDFTSGVSLVKKTVIGKKHIEMIKEELISQAVLAKDNPYIDSQTLIFQIKKPTLKKLDPRSDSLIADKFVFFDRKFEIGDALNINSNNIHSVVNASLCLLKGLSILHKNNYVHCDIKRANLLVEDEDGNTKISDFGLTVKLGEAVRGGTYIYMEKYVRDNFTKVDIPAKPQHDAFAAGITILEMLLDVKPHEELLVYNRPINSLNQRDLDYFEMELKTLNSMKSYEDLLKLRLIDVAFRLIKVDHEERLSCKKAANLIADAI